MVVSTCAVCATANALPAVQRCSRPEADATEMRTLRKKLRKKSTRQPDGDGNVSGGAQDKTSGSMQSHAAESKSVPNSRSANKKKRKRSKSGQDREDDRGTPRAKTGLATSFLFEPV